MNGPVRDFHVVGVEPDWSRSAQSFRHLDGSRPTRRVVLSSGRRAVEAWRSTPLVRREYRRGFRHGFGSAAVLYAVGSAVLILGFRALGMLP